MRRFKVNVSFNMPQLGAINWTPLWAGVFTGFLAAALSYMGVPVSRILSPVPAKINAVDTVKTKVEQKVNTFQLKKKSGLAPAVYSAAAYDGAAAYAAVDMETGEVIEEKALDHRLPIASLTKIMTAVTALDLAEPSDLFTVSRKAADTVPTKIGVVAGEQMRLDELLHAAMLTSANDAVEVIREGIDAKYGRAVFVDAMNMKAAAIGLKNSHFSNPQGFDGGANYSTVGDLAVLSHYALTRYPLLAEISRKDYWFLPSDANHKQFDLFNWNGLIGVYPGVYGLKIGNTNAAGMTTAVVSEREGKPVLAVVLGAADIVSRDLWAADLLDAAFSRTAGLPAVSVTREQLLAKYATWQMP